MDTEGFAPAKINLTLHVTGQRADGYHLLDSLVVFADVGDLVTAVPSDETKLTVTGPFAKAVPQGGDNLVLRAARLMPCAAHLTLEKHLPPASGIGGGSSDAAAALRVLSRLHDAPLPGQAEVLQLGADVPVCLAARTVRMQGTGELLEPLSLPPLWSVLVNPKVEVPTPAVFRSLVCKNNPPMPALPSAQQGGASCPDNAPAGEILSLIRWVGEMRNDLQPPAIALQPVIAGVLSALERTQDCLLARMSGSGATCFGLFPDGEMAQRAAESLGREHPDWWVQRARLGLS